MYLDMDDILKLSFISMTSNPSINAYYLRNNPARFHPDPIWNDWILGDLFVNSVITTRRTRWVVIWDQYLFQKEIWSIIIIWWWFSVVVTSFGTSTKLLYARPG